MKAPSVLEYIESLKAAAGPREIEAIATSLYESLCAGVSEKTAINKHTDYHKAVRATFPANHLEVDKNAYLYPKADGTTQIKHLHFKFTADRFNWTERNAQSSKSLVTRLKNPAVVHAERYMGCVVDCLESDDERTVSAGLIAASGRRAIEVWMLGSFEPTDDPYTVLFKGQAKRRDYDIPEDERLEFPIRLLVPASTFLKVWRRFTRSESYAALQSGLAEYEKTLQDETAAKRGAKLRAKFHSMRGKVIDRAVKDAFSDKDVFERLDVVGNDHRESAHILRHAAVNLVTFRDIQPEHNSPGASLLYAAEQLGHYVDGEDNVSSVLATLGYVAFNVDGDVPDVSDRFATSRVKIHRIDLKRLSDLGKRLDSPNQQETLSWMLDRCERVTELERELARLREQLVAEPTTPPPVEPEAIAAADDSDSHPEVDNTESDAMDKNAVESLIDSKLAAMEQRLLSAIGAGQPVAAETAPPQPAAAPPPAKPTRAKSNRGRAAEMAVDKAFERIAEYNNTRLADSDCWHISTNALQEVSGSNYAVVRRWLALPEHERMVKNHNDQYDLPPVHNRSHQYSISDVVPAFTAEDKAQMIAELDAAVVD